MSAYLRRTILTFAAAAGLVAAAAVPAGAAPPQVDYVNLGDSYSAALGTGGVHEAAPGCLQGDGPDHVSKFARHPRVDLLADAACAGLTSQAVGAVAAGLAPQLAEAELVTMTLGGNDVHWVETVLACSGTQFGDPAACDMALASMPALVAGAAQGAGATVAAVDGLTEGSVVVLGYPHLFDLAGVQLGGQTLVSAERAAQLNTATDLLNAALEQAVEANGGTFVDVTRKFAGHGLGSDDPWIALDLTIAPTDPEYANNLHPTSEGYLKGYYPALRSAVSIGRLGSCSGQHRS